VDGLPVHPGGGPVDGLERIGLLGRGGAVLAIDDSEQAALDGRDDDQGKPRPAEVVGDLRDVAPAITADGALPV
jgi:hypothetical protein